MPVIKEFNVIEPPTSGEVQERALEALLSSGLLKLTLLGQEEVPRPKETTIEFRVAQTIHPEEGGMRITGPTSEDNSVVIYAPEDTGMPATASIVTR